MKIIKKGLEITHRKNGEKSVKPYVIYINGKEETTKYYLVRNQWKTSGPTEYLLDMSNTYSLAEFPFEVAAIQALNQAIDSFEKMLADVESRKIIKIEDKEII